MTPTTIYAVAETVTRKIIYLGPSEDDAARALVGSTLHGTGPSKTAAKLAVQQQLAWTRVVGRSQRAKRVHP
ncbi:hypothetical protein LCGC14_0776340 [marine sediment metagenome]|uniref:Uncharacterized protein n=1 Tax=marine sediment metagenome TaxID=412755 RepID=A0A0F9SGQ0_9ZZZZ